MSERTRKLCVYGKKERKVKLKERQWTYTCAQRKRKNELAVDVVDSFSGLRSASSFAIFPHWPSIISCFIIPLFILPFNTPPKYPLSRIQCVKRFANISNFFFTIFFSWFFLSNFSFAGFHAFGFSFVL